MKFEDSPEMQNAFFNSRIESEKSILAISSTAIGGLILLILNTQNLESLHIVLFGAASFCFMIAAVSVVFIFHYNGQYLLDGTCKKILDVLDWIKIGTFSIGLILTIVLSIVIINN